MEYKIVSGTNTEVQRILNQWKHSYELEFIKIELGERNTVVLLIKKEIKSKGVTNRSESDHQKPQKPKKPKKKSKKEEPPDDAPF